MVSKLAAPFYIPTRNERGFQFSTSSPTLITHLFNYSYLNGCEVCLTSVLICTYEMLSDAESFFMCLLAIPISFWKKCLFGSFAQIWLFVFIVELQEFSVYSEYNFLIRYMIFKHFLSLQGLSFHFLHSVLRITKFFTLKSNLFFVIRVFGVIRKNLLPNLAYQGFMSTFQSFYFLHLGL